MNAEDRTAARLQRNQAKTAQTRRAVVDAALSIFLERGYSDTRMIDVANRAGLAKGTIYLYFTDKEALFEGVVRDVIASPAERGLVLEPAPGEPIRNFLSRVVTPVMRDMERSRRAALLRLVIAEGARFPAVAETYRRLALEPLIALIQTFAREAVRRGEIDSDALQRFPLLLMAPTLVATVWNGLYGTEQPVATAQVFEAFLDLVFGPAQMTRAL